MMKKVAASSSLLCQSSPYLKVLESEQGMNAAELMTSSSQDLSRLLIDWQEGDRAALDKLTPLVYDELRRIAHKYVRSERTGNSLQTTELVNEAYARLLEKKTFAWQNRSHFFFGIAQVMRHILIDHARRRHLAKHGGGSRQVSLEDVTLMTPQRASDLVALDEALLELNKIDPRKSRVVELRYFGGLSLEETAEALEISVMTVRRDWRAAKAWLYRAVTTSNA
jgi:RNA polymerase sigma-70 factor, ECF subfamily